MERHKTNAIPANELAIFRALAGDPALEVTHSAGPVRMQGAGQVCLTGSSQADTVSAETRGECDEFALSLRYHDQMIADQQMPFDPGASRAFQMLEKIRVEYLGARYLAGVRRNITALLEARAHRRGLHREQEPNDENRIDALHLIAREHLLGEAPPPSAAPVVEQWRANLTEKITQRLPDLQAAAEDQQEWGRLVHALMQELSINPNHGQGEEGESDEDSTEQDPSQPDDDNQARAEEEKHEQSSLDGDKPDGMSGDLEQMMADGPAPQSDGDDDADPPPQGSDQPGERQRKSDLEGHSKEAFAYKVFTREFDQTVPAVDLIEGHDELVRLREQLDRQMQHLQGLAARLATRLQRRLLAMQQRSWLFDLEEGILDTARLARVVANPSCPLSYKWEKETEFRDTIVSLLIDNSGSMRGRPISIAAISADILARTLERCGVKVEVLGFTTGRWKGGRAREAWLAKERPAQPGRLNELLHIVYKSADEPYRHARMKFALMLREGLLKENIDGEALAWAFERLLARPEERRALMVISDGAPVDDSTLSVNES
ncbi:MAG: cobaltochelatase subunit CobT, partial [Pseudomonadota bacterium]